MNDFLWDSPIYRELILKAEAEGVAEGMEKGLEKGMETGKMEALTQIHQAFSRNFLAFVHEHFPKLGTLAKRCAQKANDNGTHFQLTVQIGRSRTEQEARTLLESFLKAGA